MEKLFSENVHYVAVVESQDLTASRQSGAPNLVLRVRLVGKANQQNDVALAAGAEDLPESLRVVRTLYFDLDPNGKNIKKVMEELATLGFTGGIPQLHPQHRRFYNLVGKKALVRVWWKPDFDKEGNPVERDRWYLVTERKVESFPLDDLEQFFKDNADAYMAASTVE